MNNAPTLQQVISLTQRCLYKEAATAIQSLINKEPERAEYWHWYSIIAVKLRQAQKAIEFSSKAIQWDTDNLSYRTQLATALQHSLQFDKALTEAKVTEDMAESLGDVHPSVWDALGTIYTGCNDLIRAQSMYEKAVALAAGDSHYLFNLATSYRANGLMAEAEAIYDQVIAKKPMDYEAYANRSQLRKQTIESNHIKQMQALLEQGIKNWRDENQLCFALAKECEDVERYEEAFSYLRRGADLRRQHMRYHVESDVDAIRKIIATFTSAIIEQSLPGYESVEPIFILGLPRTGTTLVERIVDSHSEVHSAGELQNFASEMIKQVLAQNPGQQLDKLQMIEKSTAIDFKALGHNYIESTRPVTGSKAHFIDKLPLNYLYLGLIKLALPNAKIIHLTRHPMDACYAIYKTLFNEAYPFSYNLNDLGQYYLAYHHMMCHWHKLFPGQILEVSYEALVKNQQSESQRIIEYCGLEWQQQCLHFYKNPQASMTASAAQVRQPIYSSSVQKWRHYEQQLQPLVELFQAQGLTL